MAKIWNKRSNDIPADAVLVDRCTVYGNPFVMCNELGRDIACNQYENWIALPAQAPLRARAKRELKGKDLICWCAPKRCHAETLIRIANEE